MRSDMGRVVIERERGGSTARGLKLRLVGVFREGEDGIEYDGPLRVPSSPSKMRAIHGKLHEKHFTDVLGPIHGYLLHAVGRCWDDVYSEIAKNLGAFSWPLRHIMEQHIDVKTHCYVGRGGRIYARSWYGGAGSCVSEPGSDPDFYVHPVTGVLSRAAQIRRPRYREPQPGVRVRDGRDKQGEQRWFVFIRGLWFIGTYRKSPFIGTVRITRYRAEQPAPQWPDYRVGWGKDAGTYFFDVIKQANGREAVKARVLYAASSEESRKKVTKGRKEPGKKSRKSG